MGTQDIKNYKRVDDRTITGGQPTGDQIRAAAEEGVQGVVNLATEDPRYSLKNEGGLVRSLGMTYHHIPVDWNRPRKEDLDEFVDLMKELSGQTLLIHCAANYRVTAFYALYGMRAMGWSRAQAEAFIASVWQPERFPAWAAFIAQEMDDAG